MRLVEAEYSDGVLRPAQRLSLRPGERVSLIVVRRPDPRRWDVTRLAQSGEDEDRDLTEHGLSGWSTDLDAEDRG